MWNASTYPEEKSIKTSKYLCPPLASWISVSFLEFEGMLASNLDSFVGKGSLFWIDLSTNLASDQDIEHQAVQSKNDMAWPSNSESFVDPRWE